MNTDEVYHELEYYQFSSNITVVDLNTIIDIDEWKARENTVYIGDGSKWENPFKNETPLNQTPKDGKTLKAEMLYKKYGTEPVDKYEEYIESKPELLYTLWELDDKELGYYKNAVQDEHLNVRPKQHSKKCHGEILMKLRKSQRSITNSQRCVSQKMPKDKVLQFGKYVEEGRSIKDKTQRINYYLNVGFISNSQRFELFDRLLTRSYDEWHNISKYSNGRDLPENEIMRMIYYHMSVSGGLF